MIVVLLSGEIATGKTAVAHSLAKNFEYRRVSTGAYLARYAQERGLVDRDALKTLGDALDIENGGEWVAQLVRQQCSQSPEQHLWLLDSVRRDFQIPWLRASFPNLLHAHLTAPDHIKRERYESRRQHGGEYSDDTSYEQAKAGLTEAQVHTLAETCGLLVDTHTNSPEQAAVLIARRAESIVKRNE